jgi:hypothetical protein
MKQTAVEWFLQQLTTVDYGCINKTFLQNDNSLSGHNIRKLFQQAKQMEKEQIKQAYNDGKAAVIHIKNNMSLEEYYNETFKNETK